jgi:hypothetical protein
VVVLCGVPEDCEVAAPPLDAVAPAEVVAVGEVVAWEVVAWEVTGADDVVVAPELVAAVEVVVAADVVAPPLVVVPAPLELAWPGSSAAIEPSELDMMPFVATDPLGPVAVRKPDGFGA